MTNDERLVLVLDETGMAKKPNHIPAKLIKWESNVVA